MRSTTTQQQAVYVDSDAGIVLERTAPRRPGEREREIHHFTTKPPTLDGKLRLCCWCGADLLCDYSADAGGCRAMTARMSTFLRDHAGCGPKGEEDSAR